MTEGFAIARLFAKDAVPAPCCRNPMQSGPNPMNTPLRQHASQSPDSLPDPAGAVPAIDVAILKSRAQDLQRAGRTEEASQAWRSYCARQPGDAAAADTLGNLLCDLGQHEDGLNWFRRAVLADPTLTAAKINAGRTLGTLKRYDEALACFGEMAAAAPDDGLVCFHQGVVLQAMDRHDEALKWLRRACDLRPADPAAAAELGAVLRKLKQDEPAIDAYRQSVALRPGDGATWAKLGAALNDSRQFEAAVTAYQAVIDRDQDNLDGWMGLALGLLGTHRHSLALDAYRRALALQPASAAGYANMALALLGLSRFDEAIEACRKALVLEPGSAVPMFNLACAQLARGNLSEGWRAYESRFPMGGKKWARDDIRAAPWTGEPLEGKSILVLAEQGNGDQIQFARYLPALGKLGASAFYLVGKRLHRLLGSLPEEPTLFDVVPDGMTFDYQCSLMSLPGVFERRGLQLPAEPYLAAEPERVRAWAPRIGDHGFRIGVVWQGNRYPNGDGLRSYPLSALKPIAAIPGVRLISLQLKTAGEALDTLPEGMRIEDLGPDFDKGEDGFIDSAAVMATLDLVISCDTAMVHLAGALGRPVWIALHTASEWRWLRDRADTAWYPTARLFRQKHAGAWDDVFARMAQALTDHLAGRTAASLDAGPAPVPGEAAAPTPQVDVSWGELLDKITILEIKAERLTSTAALANVRRELAHLEMAAGADRLPPEVRTDYDALRVTNRKLWDIEDAIRNCEAEQRFDAEFISLARSVYIVNDERGRLKRMINQRMNSAFVEEKQYHDYGHRPS